MQIFKLKPVLSGAHKPERSIGKTSSLNSMSDDLNKKRPQDASKVNVNESWEVRYWCTKFGCTESQLRAAVKAVGVSAAKVQAYLK